MKYIEALEIYEPKPGEVSLFLAGGISNCADWQKTVVESLGPKHIVLLNPRRANFPMGDPEACAAQITWEHEHLKKATMILFWFAPETICPITLFEYGKWLVSPKRLFVGCHSEYSRKEDVAIQTALERPFQKVHVGMYSLIVEVHDYLKEIDLFNMAK